jgi:minor extracellular protease Epr
MAMRKRKSDPLHLAAALAAGGLIFLSTQILPAPGAFGAPADQPGDRVEAQVERLTEISVEKAVERTVERAEDLAAQRAAERLEELAAEKLIRAVTEEFARAAPAALKAAAVRSGQDLEIRRGAAASRFRLVRDEHGHEIAGGEGLIMVSRPQLARLLQNNLRVIETENMDGLGAVLVRFEMPVTAGLGELLADSGAGDGLTADYNHVYRPDTANAASASGEPHIPAEFYELSWTDPDPAIKLGLIDSALHEKHEVFSGARIIARDFVTYAHDRPLAHGTAVASVLVGESSGYRGIIPQSELYAASVFFIEPGVGEAATTVSLVRGLNWLVSEGVRAVNMSLTGPPNAVLKQAIKRASEQGVIIVAAVGNGGPAAPPQYPAAYEPVIAITAVDSKRAIYRLANRGPHVDFSAPGVNILCASGDGGYSSQSGTSMAAPFAAALLARALAQAPHIRPQVLIEQMRSNAEDLGDEGFDPVYGHGLIRPFPMSSLPAFSAAAATSAGKITAP